MPNTGDWKAYERKVCGLLGGRRTPLSGSMSGHGTSADCIQLDTFLPGDAYVEAKWLSGQNSAGAATFAIWEDTVAKARKEGKFPLLAMHKRGSRVEFGAIPLTLLAAMLHEITAAYKQLARLQPIIQASSHPDAELAGRQVARQVEVLRNEVKW